jgi:hypothetical protein
MQLSGKKKAKTRQMQEATLHPLSKNVTKYQEWIGTMQLG